MDNSLGEDGLRGKSAKSLDIYEDPSGKRMDGGGESPLTLPRNEMRNVTPLNFNSSGDQITGIIYFFFSYPKIISMLTEADQVSLFYSGIAWYCPETMVSLVSRGSSEECAQLPEFPSSLAEL